MKDMLQRFRFAATPVGGPVDVAEVAVPLVQGPPTDLAKGPVPAQSDKTNVLLLQGFAEGRTVFHLPEADAVTSAEVHTLPEMQSAPDPVAAILSAALQRRFAVEHLPGAAPVAMRHALILQRLGVVRDTCTVVIAGHDRSLRITMANGRVMSTTFDLPGRRQRVIVFKKPLAGKAVGREFAVLLAELCAGSVDLLMTETPASGVFDAATGVMVDALVAAAGLGPVEVTLPAASGRLV